MMISKDIFDCVEEGQELYKISKRTHSVRVGQVASKLCTHTGYAFLMEMKDESWEWVTSLNQGNKKNTDGWHLLI